MSPARARAVLAQVEAGEAHNWAAECLCDGQGDVAALVVARLAQRRRAEAIALLRAVIDPPAGAA